MDNVDLVSFEIVVADLNAFKAEFARLQKKAAKLGVAAPSYEVSPERLVPAEIRRDEITGAQKVIRPARRVVDIRVSGQAPKLAGWTFVAVLQHEAAGNLVHRVPGTDAIEVSRDLRSVAPGCDHCRTLRNRLDTYVVAHDDGRQLQVGRNCLRDFTGHDSPEAIARWAELLSVFEQAVGGDGEGGFGGGRAERVVVMEEFLGHVAAAIRTCGWLSRTKARDVFPPRMATADVAWTNIFPTLSWEGIEVLAEDIERAQKALAVVNARFEEVEGTGEVLDDYEHNLRMVVEGRSVDARAAGLAASLLVYADRLIGKQIERRQRAESQYVGVVGKRQEFRLTVLRVIDIDSMYGVTHLHILVDEAGNRFTWKASSESLDAGATYDIKGTVKAHQEYKGSKQTVLSRCKAVPVVVVEAAA